MRYILWQGWASGVEAHLKTGGGGWQAEIKQLLKSLKTWAWGEKLLGAKLFTTRCRLFRMDPSTEETIQAGLKKDGAVGSHR